MKKLLTGFVLIFFYIKTSAQIIPPQINYPSRKIFTMATNECPRYDWQLVFYDEFDGDSLNLNKWMRHYPFSSPGDRLHGFTGNCFTPTERQTYVDENVVVENGVCSLIVKRLGNFYEGRFSEFTAGMINSLQKFKYGTFEIRCKLPNGRGYWPAFWLWGGSEIDIFECEHENPDKVYCTIHRNGGSWGVGYDVSVDLSSDFHTYKVVWEQEYIAWYLDNEMLRYQPRYYTSLSQELSCPIPGGVLTEVLLPEEPMDLIANVAVGGSDYCGHTSGFGATFDETTPNEDAMVIDYIRVWQRGPENISTNQCYKEIIGPTEICSSEIQIFTINTQTPVDSTIWSVSDNIEIISSTSTAISIKRIHNGIGWINAIIPEYGACEETDLSLNVWIGPPSNPIFRIENADKCYPIHVYIENCEPSNMYSWVSDYGPVHYFLQSFDCYVGLGPVGIHPGTWANFSVTVENTCGTTSSFGTAYHNECNPGDENIQWLIAPNPGSDVIHLTLIGIDQGQNPALEYNINVYDMYNNLKGSFTEFNIDSYIDVRTLPNGLYRLFATSSSFNVNAALVINRE